MSYMARESNVKAAMSGKPQMVTASWRTIDDRRGGLSVNSSCRARTCDTGIGREIVIPLATQMAALCRDYLLAGSGDHAPRHPGRLP